MTYSSIQSIQFYIFLPFNFSCLSKTQPEECLAGSYAATRSSDCQPCPKGAFCPTKGLTTYYLCANGTYSDVKGLSDCKMCDAGFRCPSVGMEATEECPNGTYSNSTGSRYCVLCPEGHRWGYNLITNLFWVLEHIGHRYHLIIQQFIHTRFHSLNDIIGWLLHKQATDIIWLSKKPSIHVVSFIHTYWLATTETCHRYRPDYPAICPCGTFHSLVYIGWMLHTHATDIRYHLILQPFIHELFHSSFHGH